MQCQTTSIFPSKYKPKTQFIIHIEYQSVSHEAEIHTKLLQERQFPERRACTPTPSDGGNNTEPQRPIGSCLELHGSCRDGTLPACPAWPDTACSLLPEPRWPSLSLTLRLAATWRHSAWPFDFWPGPLAHRGTLVALPLARSLTHHVVHLHTRLAWLFLHLHLHCATGIDCHANRIAGALAPDGTRLRMQISKIHLQI